MNKYKLWLELTCKWSLSGLNGSDFKAWQELTTKLDKHCPDCVEGYICESCKNTGLKLNITEKLILNGIEMALDEHRKVKEKTH